MAAHEPPGLTILSYSDALYTTRRLREAATALGLTAARVDPTRVVLLHGGPDGAVVTEDGLVLPTPKVILPRVGSRMTSWSQALLRTWLSSGAKSAVTPSALGRAMDKLAASQRLAERALPVLPTIALRERWHIDDALDAAGGERWVLKTRRGTQGLGVVLAPDRASARSMLEVMIGPGHEVILIQPLIAMARPRDLRVLVLGGEPIAAAWREARQGEFRSNIHRGGTMSPAPLDAETEALAAGTAAALELPFCGVDLLETDAGWVILEANGSPGLEGIEAATGRDLATPYITRWMEAVATPSA